MDTIAPFKSRSEALRLKKLLSDRRIAATVINTPRELGTSCGLSVVFQGKEIALVASLIRQNMLSSFLGFYNK